MNANKQTRNWVIDAILLVGFLVAFFLDLTGVAAHQWLGIGVGVLAGYHLIRHWDWVKAVTRRLFGGTTAQARLYYLLDAGIMVGLGLMILSGVLISTWVNLPEGTYMLTWGSLRLPLGSYSLLRDFHVASSLVTLAVVVIKIGLHGRWIVKTARRLFGTLQPLSRQPSANLVHQPAQSSNGIARREFLTLMGIVGAAASVAAVTVLSGEAGAASQVSASPLADAGSESGASPSGNLAVFPTPTAVVKSSTNNAATTTCAVRCNKRCAFPGKCRKYTDKNGNGKCDLGECA